ncbi:hypothetical protein [Treponema socranskii]|uniref:hypothetical protein n=1 Tax=Treponema socranskii TaxID=53419 RepID=UPI003D8E4723
MAGMYPENQNVSIFGETVQWPGLNSDGKFTNGSFDDPLVKPSFIPAETLNLILDNLGGMITKLGGTPNNTSAAQLADLFVSTATANKGVVRDADGRAQVAAPATEADIARKKEIDDIINGVVALKKLTVEGDIIQKGANKITHAEDVYTKKDMIHLREGAIAALASNALAGLIAERYDGTKNGVLAFDKTGTARVGDEGDAQPLATRAESSEMSDGAFVRWNGGKQRLETKLEQATFGICTTQINAMDKTVTINGFVRQAGAHFYVKFNNDGGGTRNVYNLTLNVHNGNNYTGAAPVYVGKYQCGIGAISGGCTYEMLFDGEHYVILNSDIVAQETSESASYVKHGNGLLIQWGHIKMPSDGEWNRTIDELISYTTPDFLVLTGGTPVYDAREYCAGGHSLSKTSIRCQYRRCTNPWWLTIGF